MSIKFEDGSVANVEAWDDIINTIQKRAIEGKPNPVEIKQGKVTINVEGLEPKKVKKTEEHQNFIEANHKGWKIRVWTISAKKSYGCNYFKGEDVRYLEVAFDEVLDENGVFSFATSIIDDI